MKTNSKINPFGKFFLGKTIKFIDCTSRIDLARLLVCVTVIQLFVEFQQIPPANFVVQIVEQ